MRGLLLIGLLILMISFVAADVAVVIEFPSYVDTDCVEGEGSAYDILEDSKFDMNWQDFGFGKFINGIDGVESDNDEGYYWSIWEYSSGFEPASVGAEDLELQDGDLVAYTYSNFDSITFEPKNKPPALMYDEICLPFKLEEVDVRVDGDRESLDEGDSFDAMPGSEVEFEIELSADEEIDVEVFLDIPDLDIDEKEDVEVEGTDDVELFFDIPVDADDDEYEIEVTFEAGNYRLVKFYTLDIEKEKHAVDIEIPESLYGYCGQKIEYLVRLDNVGENDEDVDILVTSNGFTNRRVIDLEESEEESLGYRIPVKVNDFNVITEVSYHDEKETFDTFVSVRCDEPEPSEPVVRKISQEISGLVVADDSVDDSVDIEESKDGSALNYSLGFLILLNVALIMAVLVVIRK